MAAKIYGEQTCSDTHELSFHGQWWVPSAKTIKLMGRDNRCLHLPSPGNPIGDHQKICGCSENYHRLYQLLPLILQDTTTILKHLILTSHWIDLSMNPLTVSHHTGTTMVNIGISVPNVGGQDAEFACTVTKSIRIIRTLAGTTREYQDPLAAPMTWMQLPCHAIIMATPIPGTPICCNPTARGHAAE